MVWHDCTLYSHIHTRVCPKWGTIPVSITPWLLSPVKGAKRPQHMTFTKILCPKSIQIQAKMARCSISDTQHLSDLWIWSCPLLKPPVDMRCIASLFCCPLTCRVVHFGPGIARMTGREAARIYHIMAQVKIGCSCALQSYQLHNPRLWATALLLCEPCRCCSADELGSRRPMRLWIGWSSMWTGDWGAGVE